jgi:hypothetical protein
MVLGSLVVGLAGVVGFVFLEAKVDSPMVPLQLFRSRTFSGANLLTLLLYSALGVFFFVFPMNLIQVRKYSATATGAAMLPMILLMFLLSRWSGGLVSRYGARTPLVVGPLIAVPAFVILGFGMAISVAPLTTVVMSSVDQDRAGTASGINNAVARVAGVLAIAVLGVLMVGVFGFKLNHLLVESGVPDGIVREIHANSIKLAGINLPSGLDANTANIVHDAIARAFVFSFRLVVLICAALAVASAAVSLRMIPRRPVSPAADSKQSAP